MSARAQVGVTMHARNSLDHRILSRAQNKPDAGDIARISTLEREIAAASKELEFLQEKSGAIQKRHQGSGEEDPGYRWR